MTKANNIKALPLFTSVWVALRGPCIGAQEVMLGQRSSERKHAGQYGLFGGRVQDENDLRGEACRMLATQAGVQLLHPTIARVQYEFTIGNNIYFSVPFDTWTVGWRPQETRLTDSYLWWFPLSQERGDLHKSADAWSDYLARKAQHEAQAMAYTSA